MENRRNGLRDDADRRGAEYLRRGADTYTYDNNGNILTVGDGAYMIEMVRWFCGFRRKKSHDKCRGFFWSC